MSKSSTASALKSAMPGMAQGEAPTKSISGDVNGKVIGFTVTRQLQRLTARGVEKTLRQEYEFVYDSQMTFDKFLLPGNTAKNRYSNIHLWDETRVVLHDSLAGDLGDYIHASYVDGYDRSGQYILAQSPYTPETEVNMWRTICQEKPSCVIVLTPLKDAQGKLFCTDFWPDATEKKKTFAGGVIKVTTESASSTQEFDQYFLLVTYGEGSDMQSHRFRLFHYTHWTTDTGEIPNNILQFQSKVRLLVQQAWSTQSIEVKENKRDKVDVQPALITCPSGIHRSGTFCALDILLSRLLATRRVAVESTVEQLRLERDGCLQLYDHYLFLIETVVNYSIQAAFIHSEDMPASALGFDLTAERQAARQGAIFKMPPPSTPANNSNTPNKKSAEPVSQKN